eukprot:1031111-Rhodomonas_salina.2
MIVYCTTDRALSSLRARALLPLAPQRIQTPSPTLFSSPRPASRHRHVPVWRGPQRSLEARGAAV